MRSGEHEDLLQDAKIVLCLWDIEVRQTYNQYPKYESIYQRQYNVFSWPIAHIVSCKSSTNTIGLPLREILIYFGNPVFFQLNMLLPNDNTSTRHALRNNG